MSADVQSVAEVISVYPDRVRIAVSDIAAFSAGKSLKVGSYLRITDTDDAALIAAIENFCLEAANDEGEARHVIEALPLGLISDGKFVRGGDALTIPPTGAAPATDEDIRMIFQDSVEPKKSFTFSDLTSNLGVSVPVDGNRFFNKHIAVVGSTGAGKSHTISQIIQTAIAATDGTYKGMNNSHVVIFDIHSEYRAAFPTAKYLDVNSLNLPYWLLNSEELEEIILDTGERDNYNQSSIFRQLVTENKKKYNPSVKSVFYDSPLKFNIHEVLNALANIKNETLNYKDESRYMIVDSSYSLSDGKTEKDSGIKLTHAERMFRYFEKRLDFHPNKQQSVTNGYYADSSLEKFFIRFESKVAEERLDFLFGAAADNATLEGTLQALMGYGEKNSNVTIIDLSGVPFEVLSITVSLISRIVFEYGYHYKVLRSKRGEKVNNDAPILLVYEEAHKYVPNSDLAKYRSSRISIERIAKEGRKYGVTLMLSSQRPSEISETIFSQCSNFLAMRLTNPADQAYVSRLLPDTLGNLCEKLPTLKAGEALLIGESVVMPSIVKIKPCMPEPSSNDIPYFELWKARWVDVQFQSIKKEWLKE